MADASRRDTYLPAAVPATAAAARAELRRPRDSHTVEEFIGFRAGDELFALPLALVREILKLPPVTDVPRARPDVLGIVSVRGQVTTVLDVRRRLRIAAAPATVRTRVLLVDGGDEVLGLLVDEVTLVYRLAPDEIELASVLGGEHGAHIAGIGRPRSKAARGEAEPSDEIVTLLDLAALLSA